MIYPILDMDNNVVTPTIVLCHRNKRKLGSIYPISDWSITPDMNNKNECSFKVYKEINGVETPLWDKIKDLKVIYIPEYDEYFQIALDKNETNEAVKTITASNLGIAELSQTILYDIEINTEDDIARDDYKLAYIYDSQDVQNSLLGRILSKASHYKIKHVDASLCKLVRSFSVNDKSIYDFLSGDLADELNCLVVVGSDRTVSLYDLENSCPKCGHRAENETVCSECGTTMTKGYGEDTNMFVSNDNLSDSIDITTKDDEVKNTFRIQGGDDVINAAIRAVNPNGTEYINRFADFQLEDMTNELVAKINSYQELYKSKQTQYKEIMKELYDSIDKILYLTSGMMPSVEIDDTNAKKELSKLTASKLGTISVQKLSTTGLTTANNAVKSMAEIYMSVGYEVEITSSTYLSGVWKGKFKVTSVDDEKDTATNTNNITLKIDENYENFIQQKLKKMLAKQDITDDEYDWTKYCLNRLSSFSDAYQSCLDVLINMGVGKKTHEFYSSIYVVYYNKKLKIDREIKLRESQISLEKAKQQQTNNLKNAIQDELNFENYLGEELYSEYCLYRREDTYQNDNYISDGLNNSELLSKAEELFEVANKEIYKSSELQVDVSTDIGNFFTIDEFKDVVDQWKVGNWIHIKCDNEIYKVRLIDYTIKDSDFSKISCNFSSVTKVSNGISDVQSVLDNAKSMATSYDSVKRQTKHSEETGKTLSDWVQHGMNAAAIAIRDSDNQNIVYDKHGLIARSYNDITGDYEDEQLKIVNNTLAVTDDKWQTVKAAIGQIYYEDPQNPGTMLSAYGVLGETIVGKLLLGEALGIYNDGGNLQFDHNGLKITNGTNTFIVNPNDDVLLSLTSKDSNLLYVDKNGILHLNGDGGGIDLSSNTTVDGLSTSLNALSGQMVLKIDDNGHIAKVSLDADASKGSSIKINADNINLTSSYIINLITNGDLNLTGKNVTITSDYFTVDTKGKIKATSGTIGGFTIDSQNIYSDTTGMNQEGLYAFWAGSTKSNCKNAPFRVSHDGKMYASTAILGSTDENQTNIRLQNGKMYFSCPGYDPAQLYTEIVSDKTINMAMYTKGTLNLTGNQGVGINTYNEYSIGLGNVSAGKSYVCNTTWGGIITGGLMVDSSVVSSSDKNEKKDIAALNLIKSSEFIYSLIPTQFKYLNGTSNRYHHGFIAQEVKESMGTDDWGLYIDDKENGKGLRYEELIADLIATVQLQKKTIDNIQERLSILESKVVK